MDRESEKEEGLEMKAVKRGLAILLAALLVIPGSSVFGERVLLTEAAEADEAAEEAAGAESAEPEDEDSGADLTDEGLAGEAFDREDIAVDLETADKGSSDIQSEGKTESEEVPGSADAAGDTVPDDGKDEVYDEDKDIANGGPDDGAKESSSASAEGEGTLEMPDSSAEMPDSTMDELPVVDGAGSEEDAYPGNGNVQGDGENPQLEESQPEDEAELGQALGQDLPVFYAENIVANGADGNLTWTLDSDGLLTIRGTGDYSASADSNANLWGNYRDSITSAKVDVTGMTDAHSLFAGCQNLTSLDLSGFDTSNVANMNSMFWECVSLANLDLGSFDTGNVTDMSAMFAGCSNLQCLNLNNFDTSNVTSMKGMFSHCNFPTIDLYGFDTSNVTDMSEMFSYSGLTSIDLSSFDMQSVTNAENMFGFCGQLSAVNVPRNLSQSAALPTVLDTAWYLPDGTEITQLPQNLSESVLIERRSTGNTTVPSDFWFQVTGAVGHSQYSSIYIAENSGQNILDTFFDPIYENVYQTLFVSDSATDLANLIPIFENSANTEIYILGQVQQQQISGETPQDFSKGSVIYTAIQYLSADKAPYNTFSRNYTVAFAKKESGSKLFVNGPKRREIFLTDYFQNQHDILIANVGDAQLTGIKAELQDAVNVKLDDSRPVESALAAFDRVPGEGQEALDVMANFGKVRLVADGEGEISGTLKITADGQEPVYIVLTGYSSNPRITTTTTELNMDDVIRVKYVPYSYTVETNNQYEWNRVTFSVVDGELAKGLQMYPATGEIYGVPLETGEFNVMVKATFSRPEFLPSYAQLTLIVKDNTDGNVNTATDSGYDLVQRVQDIILDTSGSDSQTLVSLGEYAEFQAVYLDGEKLAEGQDYASEAGSTRITIRTQTLADKGVGSHTLGIEFRTQDTSTLKRAAQNYMVTQPGNQTGNGGSENSGSHSGGAGGSDAGDLHNADAEVAETIIYTVQPGDNLWRIAARFFGTGTLWKRIYDDNAATLRNPNRIYAGQQLVIRLTDSLRTETEEALSGRKGTVYSVMLGDNLWTIAIMFYGDSRLWEKLYRANGELIMDPRRIYAGQRIMIPAE